ncbi:hypothetical protein [Lysinibacillus xylanilyticus]|uniref:hypothetical protein n=1 Tax=Lysinibacillus xylanilyticus TaxID=582475 RepID=UPI00083C9D45|nr:hypothetical protein [Lysinibacillus xylanilyticus]
MKRLIGRPQEALLCAKAKRQQCFICAKVQRQQQQMFYLRESEASAANVLSVAKAKRQLQSAQSERKSTTRFGDEPQ